MAGPTGGVKGKVKITPIPKTTGIGPVKDGKVYGKHLKKIQADKAAADKKKKKKASPDLSGAASATSYRGGGSVSADNNQNYNDSRKNEKKDYTDYFNSASTESGKVND